MISAAAMTSLTFEDMLSSEVSKLTEEDKVMPALDDVLDVFVVPDPPVDRLLYR